MRSRVRMELQADCLAGIWAYYAQKALQVVDPGRYRRGAGRCRGIGDDRIQRKVQGRVTPDSFTHGSSERTCALVQARFRERQLPKLRHLLDRQPLGSCLKAVDEEAVSAASFLCPLTQPLIVKMPQGGSDSWDEPAVYVAATILSL